MYLLDAGVLAAFLAVLTLCAAALGRYMAFVFSGRMAGTVPWTGGVERRIFRILGIDPSEEMSWKRYAFSFVAFNAAGIAVLFLIQLLQGHLPLNQRHLTGVRWDSALNTAISFVTNTNWQSYSGESAMSPFTQMAGLSVQNFLSAAAGIAAGLAFIRGFSRKESAGIGSFWVDLVRSVIWLLLPLSMIVTVLLVSQGAVQTFDSHVTASAVDGSVQTIPLGPVASQVAIKQLGTNGGGFFGANSSHPFENPTMLTNLVENFSMLLIPFSFVFMFGRLTGKRRQARAIFAVMALLFLAGGALIAVSEMKSNPHLSAQFSDPVNMEGKETRFGVFWSAVWSQSTTVTSAGAVNAAHDSFMPLAGMVQMFNMGIGEVIFGGVGVGFIGIMYYVILSMFLAGLMIGRTPEFMGKKFGPFEMTMSTVALVLPVVSLVVIAAAAVSLKAGTSALGNPASHGLSEILYAASSCIGNNGSAFAGLNANTVFYNLVLSAAFLMGRFATVLPALAIAGSLAHKRTVPDSSATFPTTGLLFIGVVTSVVLIMGALSFFPVYALGPILEHLTLFR